jgi:hypothetical protein
MIYTFGDSFMWGWNFFIDADINEDQRKELVWPAVLAKKLNQPLTDFSLPASSNWRIARKLQSLPLTKDDIVLIGWTAPTRFEFGLADDYNFEPMHPDINYRITDYNENDDGVRTKRMSYHLMDRTTCQYAKNFMWSAYGPFNSELWFKEMFKVMFSSCQNVLEKSGCKWLAFDVWCDQCDDDQYKEVSNYILRGTNLLNASRNIPGKDNDKEYWTKEEHITVADLLITELNNGYPNN